MPIITLSYPLSHHAAYCEIETGRTVKVAAQLTFSGLYFSYCMGFKYGLEEAQSVKQESQPHILNTAHEVHPRADASILPSPSRPGMSLGTGSDASGRSTLTFKCIRCLEPATLQNSCTTGSKTMSSREHHQCMSILKSHRARMKLNPMLAQWWKQASADERVARFCRQKKADTPRAQP